jgi:hypothetical protein
MTETHEAVSKDNSNPIRYKSMNQTIYLLYSIRYEECFLRVID